ncbi:hypothetical protein BGZ95_002258 [Linnemannia exigua]|uniref:Extracellular membrane protein CFEM domain-containing protein n=1 Tax=Linnemannia exigua TaxID=604196 RepID=A0AAD4D6B5_9FUNG|nr:hypothetical protein BGZ95_002258 [Linnemannia exigua]
MRFSTTIASASILVLTASVATVSAQQVSEACVLCFAKAAITASPTCTADILISESLPGAMSPAEKACLCPLISSYTWLQPCSSPDACSAAEMNYFTQYYAGSEAAICGGGSSPSATPGTKTSSTPTLPRASTTPGAGTGTGTPSTPEPPKSDAVALFGSSSKVLIGAALGIASAVVLLL